MFKFQNIDKRNRTHKKVKHFKTNFAISMNSDSTDDIFPMAMTRNKRDEFLIDIRKKKNKTLIHQKRIMLSKGNLGNAQPVMQIEDSNTANPYLEVQNQQQFIPMTPEV